MATAKTNEQRLDEAENIIKAVLKDVRYNVTKYDKKDYNALFEAWMSLNKVTLRPDSDFESKVD
jgi:hypothetical protein